MMPNHIRIKLHKTHDKETCKSVREGKATRLRGTKIRVKADLARTSRVSRPWTRSRLSVLLGCCPQGRRRAELVRPTPAQISSPASRATVHVTGKPQMSPHRNLDSKDRINNTRKAHEMGRYKKSFLTFRTSFKSDCLKGLEQQRILRQESSQSTDATLGEGRALLVIVAASSRGAQGGRHAEHPP